MVKFTCLYSHWKITMTLQRLICNFSYFILGNFLIGSFIMKMTLSALVIILASVSPSFSAEKAIAELKGPDGAEIGSVTLIQTPHGVLVQADLKNLTEGAHGFHIHENGSCAPDFKAAGGHYNPKGSGHGLNHEGGFHAGDMPNLYVGGNGKVRADVFNAAVTLKDGDTTLFDNNGSSIIIHEKADTYGESAGAGGRVACGVITAK